jgi:hypothetical protein
LEPQIRGYSVQQQFKFLETQYPGEKSARLIEGIPPDVLAGIRNAKPVEWYPRRYSLELLRAIARGCDGNEEKAAEELLRCGTFIATEATNTFLKLLMKIMTPTLFFKKMPELWARDQRGGHFEVDTASVGDKMGRLTLCDVEGFDHIGALGRGFISYGLGAIGKSDVNVVQTGWSLKTPGPRNVTYEVTWS